LPIGNLLREIHGAFDLDRKGGIDKDLGWIFYFQELKKKNVSKTKFTPELLKHDV